MSDAPQIGVFVSLRHRSADYERRFAISGTATPFIWRCAIVSTKERMVVVKAPITFDLGRGRGNKKRGSGYVDFSNRHLYLALAGAYRNKRSEFAVEFKGKGIKSVDLSDAFERAGIPPRRSVRSTS